MMDSK